MERENDGKKTIKSSFYYMIANIISILVSLITLSLLSKTMSTSDMGMATTFITIQTILSYVVLLSVYMSINRAMLEKKIDIDQYFSTITIFSVASICIYYIIYFIFRKPINSFLEYDTLVVSFLFVSILFDNILLFLYTKWNYHNKYIKCFLYNIITSPASQLLSLLFVYLLYNQKYFGRILGLKLLPIIIGIPCLIYILVKGKFKFKKDYLKYSLLIGIPSMAHLISQIILSNSDLLMIKSLTGASDAGIYSIAYTIGNVLFVTVISLLKPWAPWVYRRLDNNEIEPIYNNSKLIILICLILSLGLITISPEMIKLFLSKDYYDSMYLIAPLCIGMFFQIIYILFYDVEYYYKKFKKVSIYSGVSAILNIILNFIFIPIFGYIAAAYTTLISYMLLAILHYFGMKKADNRKIFNVKSICIYTIILVIFSFVNLYFLNNIFIRYILFIVLLTIIIIKNLNKLMELLKMFLGAKK